MWSVGWSTGVESLVEVFVHQYGRNLRQLQRCRAEPDGLRQTHGVGDAACLDDNGVRGLRSVPELGQGVLQVTT